MSATPSDNSPAQPAWRILLVDDEPTQRLIVARLLKRGGYEVEMAANGREALAKLEQGDFPLMITDWEMPEMDGVALCQAVRSKERGYTYIILLTSRDAIEHLVAGLQSGADDYLIKPVVEPELIARLNTGRRIVTLERSLRAANEENRRLSITDPLTGVHNRRFLMEQLPREIDRAARYGRQLAAIMCDVDFFKKINDTHGHLTGDEVLKWFANGLKSGVRTSDWIARYGGEEFVIVLPETNVANAATAAEHLRKHISEQPFKAGRPGVHGVGELRRVRLAGQGAAGRDPRQSDGAMRRRCLRQQGRRPESHHHRKPGLISPPVGRRAGGAYSVRNSFARPNSTRQLRHQLAQSLLIEARGLRLELMRQLAQRLGVNVCTGAFQLVSDAAQAGAIERGQRGACFVERLLAAGDERRHQLAGEFRIAVGQLVEPRQMDRHVGSRRRPAPPPFPRP